MAWRERPLRGRFVFVALASAFTALLAGCGSGGADNGAKVAHNGAKVEASLRDYFATVNPEDTSFPQGAGEVPRVKTNSCKHLPPPTDVAPNRSPKHDNAAPPRRRTPLNGDAFWSCVVMFGRVAVPTAVEVDDSTKVVFALPNPGAGLPPSTVTLPPARTYTGGP